MSNSEMLSLNHLPLEILHTILYYLDVLDVLRIRRVNRYLNQVSHSKHVWNDVYRKADFICPPGPFLSQSAGDLEKALLPSFRVDQNLRHGGSATQTERLTLKVREIRYTGMDLCAKLVFGRFLLIAFREEVRCYDLSLDTSDSNSGASIIYRTTDAFLRSFDCVSAVDAEGHPFACAVLNEITETVARISIYLLSIGEQSEVTLDLLHQFECGILCLIGKVDLGPRVIILDVGSHLSNSGYHHVVLDVHARTQYILSAVMPDIRYSEGTSELPDWSAADEFTSHTSISTSTHALVAQSFHTRDAGWCTYFQAFLLPPPHTIHRSAPSSTRLRLSHCGLISGINLPDTVLLHDAVLEPTTQNIFIAIRVHMFEASRPRNPLSGHGLLCLSAVHHSRDHKVGTIGFRLLSPIGHPQALFLHPSFNGNGRAFYTLEMGSCTIVSALEYDLRTCGHDDKEREARVVEYPSILRFPTPRTLLDYDPYAGRICLRSAMKKYSVIEILDLGI